jgi:hypothetical protein
MSREQELPAAEAFALQIPSLEKEVALVDLLVMSESVMESARLLVLSA